MQEQFVDPYNQLVPDYSNLGGYSGGGVAAWVDKLITGYDAGARYEQNKANYDAMLNHANTVSARAWEEYFDSTAAQRRMKDIQAAGYNPLLAIAGSGVGAQGSSSVGSGSSSVQSIKKDNNQTGSNLAKIVGSLVIAAAKLAAI